MIDILEITDQLITVQSGEEEIEVSKERFQNWVDLKDKREWVKDWQECGEHKQSTGKMDWDEYFQSHYVNADLAEFLTTRQPMTGKIKDMGKLFQQFKTQIV